MKNLFKFPLNLQLFAEPNNPGNPGSEPSAQGNQEVAIDYDKMAEAINKRASQTADNVLKGYLKQQGLSGEELDQAISAYKTKKKEDDANAKQAQEDMKIENQRLKAQILNSNIDSKLSALAAAEGISMEKMPFLLKLVERNKDMKIENQRLKAQILNSNIDSKLSALAAAEGISMEKMPFLLKLVERNNLTNDKGEILEDKVKEAMNNVLKAFPDFKESTQGSEGFRKVGSSGSQEQKTELDKELDAIFGIKK